MECGGESDVDTGTEESSVDDSYSSDDHADWSGGHPQGHDDADFSDHDPDDVGGFQGLDESVDPSGDGHSGVLGGALVDGGGGCHDVAATAPHPVAAATAPVTHSSFAGSPSLGAVPVPAASTGGIAPIPGTASGPGRAISWDAAGHPTHVVYDGVVSPRTSTVTVGGNSPLYSGTTPMIPDPSSDPTHVTLGYIPAQVPHATPSPGAYENAMNYPQFRALNDLATQTHHDANTLWATGITTTHTGGSTNFLGASGKPFDTIGEAMNSKERGY